MKDFTVYVEGRPAPQGSKKLGEHGQMLEQSPYLLAWRGGWKGSGATRRYAHGAVGRAVYQEYAALRVAPESLPLFAGPIAVSITFFVDGDPAGPPDIDKLARATFDALTVCRVWEDDARVVETYLAKRRAGTSGERGALIVVRRHVELTSRSALNRRAARRRIRRLERRWQ